MADTIEQRALTAIIRHEKARQAVDAISIRIGAAIARCPIEKRGNDQTLSSRERGLVWDQLFDEKTNRVKNHLWQVFNAENHYGEHFDEDQMEDALHPGNDGCRHCLRAYRLIRQRKALRKELGHARLSIRALGRSALRMGE